MKRLNNIHPGEVLKEEFLLPMEISAYKLSKEIGIPQTRISEILKGNRRITADTAIRFSHFFGNSPKFWLGLQDDFDIEEEILAKKKEFNSIPLAQKQEKSLFLETVKKLRSKKSKYGLKEITKEVEMVREKNYSYKKKK